MPSAAPYYLNKQAPHGGYCKTVALFYVYKSYYIYDMTTYKLFTGEKEQDIAFPTGYHDLTYGQFLRLRQEYTGDFGHLLEILTGIPRAIWMNLPIAESKKILSFLQWILDSPIKWDALQVPQALHYKGVDYKIPKDLGFETFGQKIVLESKVAQIVGGMLKPGMKSEAKTPEDFKLSAQRRTATQLISFIPYIVATYMQPKVTGKPFDENEVQAVEFEILNCRAMEVYPIGNFFIRTLLGSAKRGQTVSQKVKQSPKVGSTKKKRVSKQSKKKRATS